MRKGFLKEFLILKNQQLFEGVSERPNRYASEMMIISWHWNSRWETKDQAGSSRSIDRLDAPSDRHRCRGGMRDVGVSETCYRYSPQRNADNEQIADRCSGL